jgi:cysteine desulfurase family protein (TIGR01976 family)
MSVHTEVQVEKSTFPIREIRSAFPSLARSAPFVFFDNAAGAQVPQVVLDAVLEHLLDRNVQRGGRYGKSREVDAVISRARASVATLLNARNSDEIAFGMNATSFIRMISLAIGQSLEPERCEIVITDMDHEANVATWLDLERCGAKCRWWRMRKDGTLNIEELEPVLSAKTRLIACTVASNALGTIVDVAAVAARAHQAGAEVFLDCVHYAPHCLIDVQKWDCDYLVCSGYKIFAPHMGFLWGRQEALERLRTFREDFLPDKPPEKIEAGTFIYENVAGMDAAISYLESLARRVSRNSHSAFCRQNIVASMQAIAQHERSLSEQLLRTLADNGAMIYGVCDLDRLQQRVPTVLFNLPDLCPEVVVERLAGEGIGARDGHMYSPRLMRCLDLSPESGAVRVSLAHYNTKEEIQMLGNALGNMARP